MAMTDSTIEPNLIADPMFWRQPMAERMKVFAHLRDISPFTAIDVPHPRTGVPQRVYAVTGYDEVVEISRRPKDFCSGHGAVSPVRDVEGSRDSDEDAQAAAEAAGFSDAEVEQMEGMDLGMFINMDDPRHARQRGIVARRFTPRHLATLLDSVEKIADELVDQLASKGEADLVKEISEPFPLLVILDMLGIPRSEFDTALRATNAILSAGDAQQLGGLDGQTERELLAAVFGSVMQLIGLINEIAEDRRSNPRDDLTSMLVHTDVEEDMLSPSELMGFFILLLVAGNDTTRNAISHGLHNVSLNPDQRAIWQGDINAVTPTAVEEIVRYASPVTFMARTVTRDLALAGHDFVEGDRVVLFYGAANRDPRAFDDPESFRVRRDPNPHVGFGGPGPHFCLGAHLARREVAVMFRRLLTRLPDIHTTEEPTPLRAQGIPLVSGLTRVPVRFTPAHPSGR